MNSNIEKLLEGVVQALESIDTNEQFLCYLDFISKCTSYSWMNQLLIFMQNPESTYCAGYKTWITKFGRHVNAGEKAIRIVAPMIKKVEQIKEPNNPNEFYDSKAEKEIKSVITGYKQVSIFDISQTSPIDGNTKPLPVLISGLIGDSDELQRIYNDILNVVSMEHEVVAVVKTAAKGSFDITTGKITVRSDMDTAAQIKTLLHEWSHANHMVDDEALNMSRAQKEIVAESCSYILCHKLGISTEDYSFPYIKSWMNSTDDIKSVSLAINEVTNKMIAKLAANNAAFSFLKEE